MRNGAWPRRPPSEVHLFTPVSLACHPSARPADLVSRRVAGDSVTPFSRQAWLRHAQPRRCPDQHEHHAAAPATTSTTTCPQTARQSTQLHLAPNPRKHEEPDSPRPDRRDAPHDPPRDARNHSERPLRLGLHLMFRLKRLVAVPKSAQPMLLIHVPNRIPIPRRNYFALRSEAGTLSRGVARVPLTSAEGAAGEFGEVRGDDAAGDDGRGLGEARGGGCFGGRGEGGGA